MGDKLREKILDELVLELEKTGGKGSDKAIQLTNAYYNTISEDIGNAIGGVSPLNAPFIVAALETYAEAIRKNFPGFDKTIADVKELPSVLTIQKGSNK